MSDTMDKRPPDDQADDNVVLMYPDNRLMDQVREFDETFSAFQVLKAEFFDHA